MLASTCSMRRSIEPREKDLSRELTALNRLPSIATIAWVNRFRFRHSATNCRQAERIAAPLSLRKSALVLKGHKPARQPHHLDVARRFALQTAARLDLVDVAVDVDLQHRGGVIGRTTRRFRHHALKPQPPQIQL